MKQIGELRQTWDPIERKGQKDFLRAQFDDYDPKRHDSFVDRWNKNLAERRMIAYLEARNIVGHI